MSRAVSVASMSQPELYYVGATPYVPGSHLPVVVYRGAIAHCETEDAMKEALEANGGWKKGVSQTQTLRVELNLLNTIAHM